MKSLRAAFAVLLALLATAAFAQSDSHAAFEKLKSLEGTWAGKGSEGQSLTVTFRTTSAGSAIMSEIQGPENMISMFHLDGDRLMLTHYCATGNQPRMIGTMSADGRTLTFNFLDATNVLSSQPGHMQGVVLTMLDPNHHTEEWSFLAKDGSTHHETFDVQRQK
jgi:hypothetical protein